MEQTQNTSPLGKSLFKLAGNMARLQIEGPTIDDSLTEADRKRKADLEDPPEEGDHV